MNLYVLLCLAVLCMAAVWSYRPRKVPLPPGPKPLPIIGNILDMPTTKPWEKYHEWCDLYGKFLLVFYVGELLTTSNFRK